MSETKVFNGITEQQVVIADSAIHNTATVQVRGVQSIELVLDSRDEATRSAAGDNMGVIYNPGETAQFSGFDGQIRVNRLSNIGAEDATVVVIRS